MTTTARATTAPAIQLHPDDVLFFNEVRTAMLRVAKNYSLPLRSIEALTMPAKGMADRLGQCSVSGNIHIVMRCSVDGQWADAPLSPLNVWETAAHELAHLRHFCHGQSHSEFTLELFEALRNQEKTHREKVIDKLVKMQAVRDGEAKIGNEAAAEAFAGAINKMLIEYELNPSDIDYARTADRDPVIEMRVDLSKYRIDKVNSRVAWQESLARIVANAHLCSFLLRPGSNDIWFVGTKAHAMVAEYVYGILVPAADEMSRKASYRHRYHLRKEHGLAPSAKIPAWIPDSQGYRAAWLTSFVRRIDERLDDARKAAVSQASEVVPGGESTALIRLSGALAKTKQYIDDKFTSKRRSAASLSPRSAWNNAGKSAGRAAADAMPIGRKGVTGGNGVRGLLS